ncbi:MAG TPA: hypothetical protein VFV52_04885 [Bacilli bacterium]|nr:hypothetical protein [Bacilli bacterium]
MTFDPLTSIKRVLVLHLLRQLLEADGQQLGRMPLHLHRCYVLRWDAIQADLLRQIGEIKRELRRHGVRIVEQRKTALDFQIAYLQKGYRHEHHFLLDTLQAEAQELAIDYLGGREHGCTS